MPITISDEHPERHLARLGTVFARFDRQDSGNVSYGVAADGHRHFVKTAGHPDDTPFLTHAQRVDLLRNAVRLARAYRHPALPALRAVIDSAHGPMLVYDWADGELVGVPREHRDDPASAYRRFLALPPVRVLTALDTVVDVHDLLDRAGEVAGDFYDGCLLYDFTPHRLSLIDLDDYRPEPYRNDMGRTFGSSRFMAPEEFTPSALIDQRRRLHHGPPGSSSATTSTDLCTRLSPARHRPARLTATPRCPSSAPPGGKRGETNR